MRTTVIPLIVALGLGLGAPSALHAQNEGLRVGLSFGGTSFVGVVVDYLDATGSTELTLGTFSFRDLSVSVVRRQRLGGGDFRPTVGLGLWAVTALPGDDEQTGLALIARAPIGIDWNVSGRHYLTLDANLNRVLYVRRMDPEDDTPPASRIIPLPGMAWRWLSN